MPVAAIVLAAGASRRLGQPKQLIVFGAETLLERALRLAKQANAHPLFAVLGAHYSTICATIPFHDATIVLNHRWGQGIASSIHAGLRALDANAPHAAGALLMGCDQPRLTAAHLHSLLAAFSAPPTPRIVASAYAGIVGVPAVFPREIFPHLHALRGDKGARALLAVPPCPLILVDFAGGEVDIDLPSDLALLD